MIQAPYLNSGDSVYLLSTARKITLEELTFSIKTLKYWGLNVVIGDTIGAEDNQFAGTDQVRINDFNKALHDPKIKAIVCARGGYGTVRIVDHLDWGHLLENPKWICGYSDVTTIHSTANLCGVKTIHSTMPINFETNTVESLTTLKSALFGQNIDYSSFPYKVHRRGKMEGELIGGNLSIIYSLLGSPSCVDTKRKILFIEDLDEYLYHIDRMMVNIKRNRYFEGLSGLIIGGMTDMNDNTIPYGKKALEIIFEHVEEYDFPIIYDFPAGHIDDNRALILGQELSLNVKI